LNFFDLKIDESNTHSWKNLYQTSCNYPSSGRSSTRAFRACCSEAPRLVSRDVIAFARCRLRRRVDVVCASFARCRFRAIFPGFLSLPHAYINDLEIDLARNTPWVDMSACQVWSRSAQPFGRPYGT